MVFQNISLNLSALESVQPLNVTVNESTLTDIISVANSSTNNYFIFGTLLGLFIIVYVTLSDKTPFQNFGYDDTRAINIGLAMGSLIGLTMVSVGWSNNFFAVGMFVTMWVLSLIFIYMIENRS